MNYSLQPGDLLIFESHIEIAFSTERVFNSGTDSIVNTQMLNTSTLERLYRITNRADSVAWSPQDASYEPYTIVSVNIS